MKDIKCWEKKFESCYYSDRLLTKLSLINKTKGSKLNLQEIKKAIYYAKKYHGAQTRQSGEPYYSHPLEVAYIAADYVTDTNIIITSILHDTIEDTALTKEMINLIFGSTIANQVENLTRIKEGKKISSAKMLESLWFQKKLEALFIKQIDRLHNMRTISFKSPPKIKEITLETVEVYIIIAIYLGLTDVEQELKQLCLQANIKSNLCQQFDYKFYSEEYFPLPFPI